MACAALQGVIPSTGDTRALKWNRERGREGGREGETEMGLTGFLAGNSVGNRSRCLRVLFLDSL